MDANTTIRAASSSANEWLFGWDPTPGILSVWAERSGRAQVWQRVAGQVACTEERFRPFLFAATLDDVAHLGGKLVAAEVGADSSSVSYQELDGPPGSYCYLLSAASYPTLERAILTGVAQRTGKAVSRVNELAGYYTVGMVEQYLMRTGRTYFKNMVYSDLHRLQFDLETTSLNPSDGRIFLVAIKDSHGLELVLEAPQPDDEAKLIAELCALIRERDPDVIENHNLFGFDLPFLEERAKRLRVPLTLGRGEGPATLESYSEAGWHHRRGRSRFAVAGRELVDTLPAVWRHDFTVRDMPGYGLKAVARYFGVASPDRTYIPGAAVYSTYERDPEQVRAYALDDVREVDALSQILMGASFALAGMAPRPYGRVVNAGPATGILEPMLVRAYLRASAALPRVDRRSEAALGPHSGGATYLLAGGVARHVVKADISSMYPSIMGVYQIGPACDHLGVMLGLVKQLVELRLEHKDAINHAASPAQAQQHRAMAAAMKVIVNSAYGYMGAGEMALFADREAADAVTSKGRAILDQVISELKARGMALLEADTDGVFFAVPESWSEAEERKLVRDVAAQLPAGIRLEYEGRYAAMLSHEVKNYALLTYDGELVLRGGAFRSSRSELFGVRFLADAIGCLLRGDVSGVERVYREVIDTLRTRRLTTTDVATRARLTKTYAEYQATRRRLREAPYEALIAAGREHWEVGERVRYYRAEGGQYVWLPDTLDADGEVDNGEIEDLQRSGYDIGYYIQLLHTSYVSRLRKAFRDEDFARLFRADAQLGLFDQPSASVQPVWIGCAQ